MTTPRRDAIPLQDGASRPATRSAADPFLDPTLADVGRALARHARALIAAALLGAVVLGAYAFTRPRTYTATAAFVPQSSRGMQGQLAGLAAQFGIGAAAQGTSYSPAFFGDLLRSRSILRSAAAARYTVRSADGVQSGTLPDIYGYDGEGGERLERAVDELRGNVDVVVGRESGLIRLNVTAEAPALALQIAQRVLAALSATNQEMRRSQAEAEQEFSEQRLEEARAALTRAENRLRDFLRGNREYSRSPDLLSEYERLTREVSIQRELFTSLAQSVAQTRMEALRTTPVVTIVEPPNVPARPDPRGTVIHALVGALAAGAIGALLVLFRAFYGTRRATSAA